MRYEQRSDGNHDYVTRCAYKINMLLGSPSSACETRRRALPQPKLSGCFGICFQQPRRDRGLRRKSSSIPNMKSCSSANLCWTQGKDVRKILKEFWTSYVGDVIDIADQIQTEAEISYAFTVVDQVDWVERKKGRATVGGARVDNSIGRVVMPKHEWVLDISLIVQETCASIQQFKTHVLGIFRPAIQISSPRCRRMDEQECCSDHKRISCICTELNHMNKTNLRGKIFYANSRCLTSRMRLT